MKKGQKRTTYGLQFMLNRIKWESTNSTQQNKKNKTGGDNSDCCFTLSEQFISHIMTRPETKLHIDHDDSDVCFVVDQHS
jgi:hypothetical protein